MKKKEKANATASQEEAAFHAHKRCLFEEGNQSGLTMRNENTQNENIEDESEDLKASEEHSPTLPKRRLKRGKPLANVIPNQMRNEASYAKGETPISRRTRQHTKGLSTSMKPSPAVDERCSITADKENLS